MDQEILNLYSNYAQGAQTYPNNRLILDEALPAFPELSLETTFEKSLGSIEKRAYQLSACGVKKGDKVIIYKSPKFDTYLLAVAVSYLGAVPVMVSYHLPVETLDVFSTRLEVPYILFDDETEKRVIKMANHPLAKQFSVHQLLQQEYKPVAQAFLQTDEISYMTHTSGTTGIPKLICHSGESMGWRTIWQKKMMRRIEEPEALLAFHISPVHSRFNIGVSSLMALGFNMMPINQSNQQVVSDMLEKYEPIALETHPNNFVRWRDLTRDKPECLASVKYYHSTFDAINEGTMFDFLSTSKMPNPIFLQVYGQSECGPMIWKTNTLETLKTPDSRNMGIGLDDLTQARITDDKGNELPRKTDGNIQFLSKGRALTYYKEEQRFSDNVYDKWWDSGDYGSMDTGGQLYLKDRQVDLVANINSTLAIEDFLLDSFEELEEVVIVRGKEGKPQPIIAIKEESKMNWDKWWELVENLPHMNRPLIYAFEAIPRTATMKVQRLAIEQELLKEG